MARLAGPRTPTTSRRRPGSGALGFGVSEEFSLPLFGCVEL